LDRISTVVHEMGNIWREMTKDDFGLDGEIEVVTPKVNGEGFETAGGIVKVQSKAGESYVRYDSDTSFSSPVDQNDLEYWQKCTFPVLYIVYHPNDDKLSFKEVKAYIRDTPGVFSKPHHIKFDKAKDEFTASSKAEVCKHAKVSPPRIAFDQKERLFTNLLPIRKLPETLYYATTRRKSRESIRDEIEGFVPPFCIVDGKLYSLSDLADEKCALNKFCLGKVGTKPATEWIADEARVNDFIFLLNQLLGKHMGRCGVRYNRDFGRNYFPRESAEGTAFKRAWTSVRTGVADERTVVKYYEYGKDKFWRHLASETSFERFGGAWFLRITPKYFFTEDGEKPCDSELVGPYTTSLKADEHNSHVLNHVLFWADVLAFHKERLIEIARLNSPLFQEPSEEMDETWRHGTLIGGMACRDLRQVARAYKLAADELLKQALEKYEPHELDYPVLFLYRHTVEVYLKAALGDPPEHHDLSRLIQLLEAESGKKIAPWVKDRLWDFHKIDSMAALFRYADPPADGELWIDFHQLQAVIDKLVQAVEQYIEQKKPGEKKIGL
jgi:hypothetical protein